MIEDIVIGQEAMEEHIALIRSRCREVLAELGAASANVRIHLEIGIDLGLAHGRGSALGWSMGDTTIWEGVIE